MWCFHSEGCDVMPCPFTHADTREMWSHTTKQNVKCQFNVPELNPLTVLSVHYIYVCVYISVIDTHPKHQAKLRCINNFENQSFEEDDTHVYLQITHCTDLRQINTSTATHATQLIFKQPEFSTFVLKSILRTSCTEDLCSLAIIRTSESREHNSLTACVAFKWCVLNLLHLRWHLWVMWSAFLLWLATPGVTWMALTLHDFTMNCQDLFLKKI